MQSNYQNRNTSYELVNNFDYEKDKEKTNANTMGELLLKVIKQSLEY